MPLRGFAHAFALILGKRTKASETEGEGQINHRQGLTNALASTIGLGNIAGVAVAITQGGPGAVFWMWVAGLIGMNTKFFECTLSLMYRGKDYRQQIQGGPMYVVEQALGKHWQPVAYLFAGFGLIGTTSVFNSNQLATYLNDQFSLDPLFVGVIAATVVVITFLGGVKRLAKVTQALVPSMCVLYLFACGYILLQHFEQIPGVFVAIFQHAWTGEAAWGGVVGMTVGEILQVGVRRAAFSNEAGMGTAPMAHGNVKTAEPASEGLVAMLGPFFDTVIVCTLTALVILVNLGDANELGETSGILLTLRAFEASMPYVGSFLLGAAVFLFSLTSILGLGNYNQKCWNFLFKGRRGLGRRAGIIYFGSTVIFGAVLSMDNVVNIIDISTALMVIPNMFITLYLAGRVKAELDRYLQKINLH